MTLRIDAPTLEERQKAYFDLLGVCRDVAEGMTFDSATGEVLFHAPPGENTAGAVCTNLADGPWTVVIAPRSDSEATQIDDPWVPPQPRPSGVPLVTHPLCSRGVAAWPTGFVSYMGASGLDEISIAYDAVDYPDGAGYKGYDDSGAEIPVAPQHLLAFGIGSAVAIGKQFYDLMAAGTPVDSTTPWTPNADVSLFVENLVRAEGPGPARVGPLELYLPTCSEQPGLRMGPPPPKTKTIEWGNTWKCFVATAAYGSPLAPEVQMLREFRDTVLRRTRTGEAWFERFYRRYDEVSQPIAARMRKDPELADLLRVGIVQPYVGWLELAQTMPEAPLDEVPEPWREFLALLIDRMDAWASKAMPDDLDGLDGLAAARELAVVLRYGFRDHGRRSAYLDRLAVAGALPLPLSGDEAREARRILLGAGLPASHVARVVAEVPEEARR